MGDQRSIPFGAQPAAATTSNDDRRAGLSLIEVLFVLSLLSLLFLLFTPKLLSLRELSRRSTCQHRLAVLTKGLQAYHLVHNSFPPAAIWNVDATASIALHRSRRIERVTHSNWSLLVLPHIESLGLSNHGDPDKPIGDAKNQFIRLQRLPEWLCPSDNFNRSSNPYQIDSPSANSPLRFARGNFAINGGSHHHSTDPPSTTSPRGDHITLEVSEFPRQFRMWGNGIAGINKSFREIEFQNGKAHLVALEEVRAGVQPLDPRGVWALGQIGGSITWAHGINGDDTGPNQTWIRGDDVLNCPLLHTDPGTEELSRLKMPCVDYVDINQQATSRSQHSGGVYVSFLDGSVKFISDTVDPGVWHVMHSRETPATWMEERLSRRSESEHRPIEGLLTSEQGNQERPHVETLQPFHNSLMMEFVPIASGKFLMGTPDTLRHRDSLDEFPPHEVILTESFWLGASEVTRDQYAQLMGEDELPSLPDSPHSPQAGTESGNLPVTGISWYDASRFCELLTNLPAERAAKRSYRLPSEAEWEYACRAGAERPHSSSDHAVTGEGAGKSPPIPLAPVKSFPPNGWGLFDMRGNAWEWMNDWYERGYYLRSPTKNPTGPATGAIKVVRGSRWRFTGEECLIDSNNLPPWKGNPVVGFRVACIKSN